MPTPSSLKPRPVANDRHQTLIEFCQLANREILKFYGGRASCVFSTGVCRDVLNHFNIKAEPLRVTAAVFSDDGTVATLLGSDGCGQRMKAASPNMWNGHLVSLVENEYLLDSTLDQVNTLRRNAKPCVVYLPDTCWFEKDSCTQNLDIFGTDTTVRYNAYYRQNGWRSAPDFKRKGGRQHMARLLIRKINILGGRLRQRRGF